MSAINTAAYAALASQNQTVKNAAKPFFYEIEQGQWLNIGTCSRIYISKSWGSYYINLVVGSNYYYIHREFNSYEEAHKFLQEEIFNKLN